ncbi:HDIG domain-containing protein [Clostridium sp. 19966]|uniref:HD family phosphohydrolase n=1 Tax=Clostridium sp. 19966 TaxID=2768166 RepID=UPI0028E0283C|nr:HDIG domain-containing metalloprotein [Clostridium sp. 19966]MDT8715318.1 HDIG domain-containing protein [Clostridium sp. 19966]
MRGNKEKRKFKIGTLKVISVFFVTFFSIYFILVTTVTTKRYTLSAGDIAKYDIKAPREIVDQYSTDLKIKKAQEDVPLQYEKENGVKNTAISNINSFFSSLYDVQGENIDIKQKIDKFKSSANINLNDSDYNYLLTMKQVDMTALQEAISKAVSDMYDNSRIEENNSEDVKKAQQSIESSINSTSFSLVSKQLAINIADFQIKPNFFFDSEKTESLKKEAVKDVQNVVIKKDQIIVKSGEQVTDKDLQIMSKLGLLNNNSLFQWSIYISLGALVILILLLIWFYLFRYHKDIVKNIKNLVLINLLVILSVGISRALGVVSPYMIPFACLPLLLTLLMNYRISLVVSAFSSVFVVASSEFNVEIAILVFLNAIIGVILLQKTQSRNDILFSSVFIVIINVACILSVGILLSNNISEILKKVGFVCVGSILSGVLTLGLLPFLESSFDIVTIFKLLELANPNHPILKKLLMEAPGTYHHSILVANLAELAADSVGANSVLARVGAYYHDVGKIKRPLFFKENQMNTENPHDKITPNLSALIIISHVKDGLELAKEYKLPQSILDIIEQHHGNSLVKYFYVTMKNSSDNPEEVLEEDFRYSGPIPTSKEATIVMLADSVEAAVRAVGSGDNKKIEEMVDCIFEDKFKDGQLSESELNMKEIKKIKEVFLKTLVAMYHKRIEYPKENKKVEIGDNINVTN